MRGNAAILGVALLLTAACGATDPETAKRRATVTGAARTTGQQDQPGRKLLEECKAAHARGFRVCERGLWIVDRCAPGESPRYDGCGEAVWTRATIERRLEVGWRRIAAAPRGAIHFKMVQGHWRDAWLSPDGATLLAQWSAECEVPFAFFIPARGGPLQPVTGERDWMKSPESVAHGWAADGRARVSLPASACGTGHPEPGRYLVDPDTGELERTGPLAPGETP